MIKAVFGGAFDPPHHGHLKLARCVITGHLADHVVFVPSFEPPHKSCEICASYEDRLQMTRLIVESMPDLSVSDIEGRMASRPSFTYETMLRLSSENPSDELVVLIGTDSLKALHQWHKAVELAGRWRIISYPRPGFQVSRDFLEDRWPPEIAAKLYENIANPIELSPLASSQIRYNIKNHGDYDGVPETVRDYIIQKKIYLNRGGHDA